MTMIPGVSEKGERSGVDIAISADDCFGCQTRLRISDHKTNKRIVILRNPHASAIAKRLE